MLELERLTETIRTRDANIFEAEEKLRDMSQGRQRLDAGRPVDRRRPRRVRGLRRRRARVAEPRAASLEQDQRGFWTETARDGQGGVRAADEHGDFVAGRVAQRGVCVDVRT